MEFGRTAYVILGMLALGKRTGYEIKSLVDVSTRFFWAASYGQIYPELGRLEAAGLVRGQRDAQDARRRKSYELTPAGEEALREWLTSDEPPHLELRHEGLLRLFFSDTLEPDEQLEQIRRLGRIHEETARQLRSIEPRARAGAARNDERFTYLTLEFGLAYNDFIADWCSKAERRLASELKAKTRS